LWLKAKAEQKLPDQEDEIQKPSTGPGRKDTLDEKDPQKSDEAYQPANPNTEPRKRQQADDMHSGSKSDRLTSGTIRVLPDEEPIRPLTPEDALKTLEKLARDIAEQRRRQRHPTGPATLATKDW